MVLVGFWGWAYALIFIIYQLRVRALEPKDFARLLLSSGKSDIQFEKNKTIVESEALRLLHGHFSPEPENVPADPELGNITLAFGDSAKYELYKITPRECYLCRFPPGSEIEKVNQKQRGQALSLEDEQDTLTDAIRALQKLRGTCLSYFQGYFAYEFCYNFQIRQLPISKHLQLKAQSSVMSGSADPANNIYILGKWKKQLEFTTGSHTSLEHYHERSTLSANTLPSELDQNAQKLSRDQHLVLEQSWSDGTICDLNGVPRTTIVKPKIAIYPIQCRLVTPDDEETRKSYLKKINFHRIKPSLDRDNPLVSQLENAQLDEPLEFEMTNALESDQESDLVDQLNALDQDDKWNSAIQDLISRIQPRSKTHVETTPKSLKTADSKTQAPPSHTETERKASADDIDRLIQALLNAVKQSRNPTYEAKSNSESTPSASHTTKDSSTQGLNHDEL